MDYKAPARPSAPSDRLPRRQHEFPKSSVDVFVHVLQDDGGALAAAVTAASAALADASVPMYDLVTAAALVSALSSSPASACVLTAIGEVGDVNGKLARKWEEVCAQIAAWCRLSVSCAVCADNDIM